MSRIYFLARGDFLLTTTTWGVTLQSKAFAPGANPN
jgi:hypothetical protein